LAYVGKKQMETRITPGLATRVQHIGPMDVLQVVVELQPLTLVRVRGLSRKEQIINAKKTLSLDFETIKESIQRLGGEVLDYAWLNQTILAEVPASQVSKIAHLEKVQLVDLPHVISVEAAGLS
jgi:hypothetical protein